MADPTQVSGTTLELVVSTTTTGVTAILRINNAVLAGIVSVGALSLGAYYLANRRPVENAVRNGLERRNEAGVVDPEVRNIEEGSILVELHCQTEHSFIQFVEDFEAEKVKHRLEKEFKRIGFSSELLVTIENAYEVNKKVEMIRLSQKGSRTEKVEGGSVKLLDKMATVTGLGPMDDKHRNILRRCKGTLVKDMEPNEVLLKMVDPLLFTTEDENKIKSRVTRQQQCETLLEMLPRKGAKAYEIFKKTLQIVHPHLARTIVEAENKELNYQLELERENSADLRRRLAYTKVKQGTPTDKELEKLGMDIGDIWKKLGRRLYVTDAKQKEIDRAHELLSEKAYYTLKHWKQSKGAAANYQALCDALQDEGVERQDLVEKYCYIKEMDTGTRPLVMERVELSRPIQAEQVSSTEIDTGTRPPAVGLVEPSRSIPAEHLETLESQIVDAVKQLQVVEANCKDVENRLKEKQQELQVVEANFKDVENRLKEKQEELKDVEGKCRDAENRLKEKQEGQFSIECRSAKTKVIILANNKEHRQYREPIKT